MNYHSHEAAKEKIKKSTSMALENVGNPYLSG
jgi:hypothetical protein